MATPEDAIKQGDLNAALEIAKNMVRSHPEETRHRILLFQIESVLGHWEKADLQLQTLAEMDRHGGLLAQIFRPVIESEHVRQAVFSGTIRPTLFGEPEEWMGKLVEALRLTTTSDLNAGQRLRREAFEEAPASPGSLNGQELDWVADADSRLGPMLELILQGKYFWAPFCRISSVRIDPPQDLRDLVWLPATFTWVNGGTASGFIPTRYPGSDQSDNPTIQLARRTEWREQAGDLFVGSGQRELVTSQGQYALLEIREIALSNAINPALGSHV